MTNQLKFCPESLRGILQDLRIAEDEVRQELSEFQEALEEEWESRVVPKLEALNEMRVDAEGRIKAVHASMSGYIRAQDASWQASPGGRAFQTMLDGWDLQIPVVTMDAPGERYLEDYSELPSVRVDRLVRMK